MFEVLDVTMNLVHVYLTAYEYIVTCDCFLSYDGYKGEKLSISIYTSKQTYKASIKDSRRGEYGSNLLAYANYSYQILNVRIRSEINHVAL